MSNLSGIREHMEVIGADGVHVGIVHEGHHHYVPGILVAAVEGDKVRLSADAANAELFEEEQDGKTRH
ncbi:MAG: hypothetical protein ABS47_25480 [Devosia sp. SCN 66-27]|nr:MAG: hypothetical protein ABS47_25480 [Devosia sp. SCN 66-27]